MDTDALAAVDLDRLWFGMFGDVFPRPEGDTDAKLRERLAVALSTMTERDVQVLLDYFTVKTANHKRVIMKDVAAKHGVSHERIRQIIARSLRRMRVPYRSRPLLGLEPLQPAKPFEITEATEIRELLARRLINTRAGHGLLRGPYVAVAAGQNRPINTVGETRHVPDAILLRIRQFGVLSLAEVRHVCGPFEKPAVLPRLMGRYGDVYPEDEAQLAELDTALQVALGNVSNQ